jgi:hypothetical protein
VVDIRCGKRGAAKGAWGSRFMAEMTPREERRGEREGGRVEELVAGVIGRMA